MSVFRLSSILHISLEVEHVSLGLNTAFNELRAERMAKNANPLALVATAQTLQDTYYQSSKSHKSYAPTSKASLPTRSHATTRYKGKEIAKPIIPPSERVALANLIANLKLDVR
ncbi:hypothetical protein Tco_1566870 [Tanacetum coccineum]